MPSILQMPHTVKHIACIGEVMLELMVVEDTQAQLGVAGDTFNTAVYLKRELGDAVAVSYITALGMDVYSERIIAALQHHQLGAEYIERRQDKNPGLYAIDTDDQGERSFTYWRSDSAARTLFQSPGCVALERLHDFDLLFLSGISVAILPPDTRRVLLDFIDVYRARGGILVYDSNHRPKLWEDAETARQTNQALWQRTDIALPSADDEAILFGDTEHTAIVQRLQAWGVRCGALKRGGQGPLDIAGGPLQHFDAVDTVVDSTAAGDSFNAAYLAALTLGKTPTEAMYAGHALASRVIAHKGAIRK